MTASNGRNEHIDNVVYIWDYHLKASVYVGGRMNYLTLAPDDPICETAKQIVDMLTDDKHPGTKGGEHR